MAMTCADLWFSKHRDIKGASIGGHMISIGGCLNNGGIDQWLAYEGTWGVHCMAGVING